MTTDQHDNTAQRILQHHQEHPYPNDPQTRPTLHEVLPELEAEPWYRLRQRLSQQSFLWE